MRDALLLKAQRTTMVGGQVEWKPIVLVVDSIVVAPPSMPLKSVAVIEQPPLVNLEWDRKLTAQHCQRTEKNRFSCAN